MTTGEAIQIVNQYGARTNAPGFLECIESMDKNTFQLTETERSAYLIVIEEMSTFC